MTHEKKKGWLSLLLAGATIAIVWTVLLPWIGARPALRESIEQLDAQGIDPAAMYYTDVEAMGRVEADLAEKRAEHPEAFWGGTIPPQDD